MRSWARGWYSSWGLGPEAGAHREVLGQRLVLIMRSWARGWCSSWGLGPEAVAHREDYSSFIKIYLNILFYSPGPKPKDHMTFSHHCTHARPVLSLECRTLTSSLKLLCQMKRNLRESSFGGRHQNLWFWYRSMDLIRKLIYTEFPIMVQQSKIATTTGQSLTINIAKMFSKYISLKQLNLQ
jgi:hypothetical protein